MGNEQIDAPRRHPVAEPEAYNKETADNRANAAMRAAVLAQLQLWHWINDEPRDQDHLEGARRNAEIFHRLLTSIHHDIYGGPGPCHHECWRCDQTEADQ
jgi:hypothetical protein